MFGTLPLQGYTHELVIERIDAVSHQKLRPSRVLR